MFFEWRERVEWRARRLDAAIARLMGASFRPEDLRQALERALQVGRYATNGRTYVHNYFELWIHPRCALELAWGPQRVAAELEGYLRELVAAQGYRLCGEVRVVVGEHERIRLGDVRVVSRFAAVQLEPGQLVSGRRAVTATRQIDASAGRAVLWVWLGSDWRRYPLVPGEEVTIGRDRRNRIVLEGRGVEVQHAIVRVDNLGRWCIAAWERRARVVVNGQRGAAAVLGADDRIVIGDAELRFRIEAEG
jgi:hypothetical protein